ncbi:thyroid peroxidase [Petromyzon marinus]|uniref:thyroid peroxidase n=1 Tax=Petromyzon marinus TaxID=7757 RepID=UPI003F6FEC2A
MKKALVTAAFLGLVSLLVFSVEKGAESSLTGYLGKLGDPFVNTAVQEALHMVDSAIFNTVKRSSSIKKSLTPVELLAFFKRPEPESQQINRAAEVMETTLHLIKHKVHQRHKRSVNATDLLSMDVLRTVASLSGCRPHLQTPACPNTCLASKYRTISGMCNNRFNPRWGSTNVALARWLPAEYEDGFSEPKGWNPGRPYNGFPLPMVRTVSNEVMSTRSGQLTDDDVFSHIIVEWGQYVDHDFALTPQSLSQTAFMSGLNCKETCDNRNPCFPMKVPANDPRVTDRACLPFFRSSPVCGTGEQSAWFGAVGPLAPRQQINALTSFIDASTVYGSTPAAARALRDLDADEGLMKANARFDDGGRELLPFQTTGLPTACAQDPDDPFGERIECFAAGDNRASEVLTLASVHTLWVREHNRLARALRQMNPHWSGETTYQEARKIVGALHQIITMRDYFPKILGEVAFEEHIGSFKSYNPGINPTVSNVFTTAAYRFGHATISSQIRRLDENFQEHPRFSTIDLHEAFFSPWRIIKEGGLDPLLRGLLARPAKLFVADQMMTEELRDRLFELTDKVALDLASLNLQRGRDHGLPGYNDWRQFCGLSRLETAADLSRAISSPDLVAKLMELYGHPNNVDVWLGGLAEDLLPDSRVGPLFACLIGRQMKALRDGDRFWWENPGVFTPAQRTELSRHSLSRVVCDNSGLTEVPVDAFILGRYPADFVSCSSLPALDLQAWQERPTVGRCGEPPSIQNGGFVLCASGGEPQVSYMCHSGYRLTAPADVTCTFQGWSSPPPTCDDVDECSDETTPPPCHASASCVNTDGGFECACTDPYVLADDRRTCIDSGNLSLATIVSIVLGFVSAGSLLSLIAIGIKQLMQMSKLQGRSSNVVSVKAADNGSFVNDKNFTRTGSKMSHDSGMENDGRESIPGSVPDLPDVM